jgi:hypothetical protein
MKLCLYEKFETGWTINLGEKKLMWNFVNDVTEKIVDFKIKLSSKTRTAFFFHLWIVRNSTEWTFNLCGKKWFYAFGLCKNDSVFSQ